MLAPNIDRTPGVVEIHEPKLVEVGVTELAIEAFDERVLGGLPRLNEVQRDAGALAPSELFSQHLAGHLLFQHGIRQQPLQARVLTLQCLQPLGIRYRHPAKLVPPQVVAGF